MNLLETKVFFNIDLLINEYKKYYTWNNSVSVAVSGGADSLALLLLLINYSKKNNIKLNAYTVNHNLREEAIDEALYVSNLCKKHSISHKILNWEHEKIEQPKLELSARKARYQLLMQESIIDKSNLLFIAHTENDVIETFFLRKLKKSKEVGLASISAIRELCPDMTILRPLLNIQKTDLIKYLKEKNIDWKEDISNQDTKFLRARIRKFLNQRKDTSLHDIITKRIKLYAYTREKLETFLLKTIFSDVIISERFGYAEFQKDLLIKLDTKTIDGIKNDLSVIFVQKIISLIGGSDHPFSIVQLKELLSKEKTFSAGNTIIKFSKNNIIIFRENKNINRTLIQGITFFDNRFLIKYQGHDELYIDKISEKLLYLIDKNLLNIPKKIDRKIILGSFGIFNKNNDLIAIPQLYYFKNHELSNFIKFCFHVPRIPFQIIHNRKI